MMRVSMVLALCSMLVGCTSAVHDRAAHPTTLPSVEREVAAPTAPVLAPRQVTPPAQNVAAPASPVGSANEPPVREPTLDPAQPLEREVLPASLEGLSTVLSDPAKSDHTACRGVMSEGQLCTCLTGAIDPQFPDDYSPVCRHRPLGVPGFGVFTDRAHSSYVTVEKDGGHYWLEQIDSAGTASWEATGARMMRAGKRDVLAIDVTLDASCGEERWLTQAVTLCVLRALDDPDFGRCVRVPVRSVYTQYSNAGDPPVDTVSEATFRITGRGTVVVRARGKADEAIARGLGEHRL